MGSDNYGVTAVDFVLSPGEYINEVHGRAGELIDMIGFKTTMGRSQSFGTSHGGHHFSLQVAGKVVKGFRVGFGGSLHFIGVHFGDVPASPSYGGAWPSPGGYPAPVPGYSSVPGGFSTSAPVYTPAPGYGAPSPSYGAPAPSYGMPSPYGMPAPSYSMPAPSYSAPAPSYSAPAPSYSSAPVPGYSPAPAYPSMSMPEPIYSPPPMPAPSWGHAATFTGSVPISVMPAEPVWGGHHGHGHHAHHGPQKCAQAGKTHSDTHHFDDYTHCLKGKSHSRLSKLRVLHDGSRIYGIESVYDVDGY